MNSPEALRWKSIVWLLALSATLSQTAVSSSDGNPVCPEGYRAVAAPGYDSLHTSFHHLVPGRALACECAPGYGSHVAAYKEHTHPQYSTTPPSCHYVPASSSLASSSRIDPACRCFRCPAGFSSVGGALHTAACVHSSSAQSARQQHTHYSNAVPSSSPASEAFASLFRRSLFQKIVRPSVTRSVFVQVTLNTRPPSAKVAQGLCKIASFQKDAATAVAAGVMQMGSIQEASGTTANCWSKGNRVTIIVQVAYVGSRTFSEIKKLTTASKTAICKYGTVCNMLRAAGDGKVVVFSATAASREPKPPSLPSCTTMPANTSPPNSQGWSSSCVGTLVGETCEAACLSTATGKILATCNEDKTWTVTGTCEVINPVRCAGLPTLVSTVAATSLGWPATCLGTAVGKTCTALCKQNFAGTGYVTTCIDENQWGSISGGCTSPGCLLPPPVPDPELSAGYNSSCTTAAATGAVCQSPCLWTSSGIGFQATCELNGDWSILGSCTPKKCSASPAANLAPLGTGWPASCANTAAGKTCTAPCNNVTAVGNGYVAMCNDTNTWAMVPDSGCTARKCAEVPAANLATDSTGWNVSCTNAAVGGTCKAACVLGASGPGYTATCKAHEEGAVWSITGSCSFICMTAPNSTLAPNAAAWNSSCAPVMTGGSCRTGCAVNATGDGYTALCGPAATWQMSGSCTLKTCSGWPTITPPVWSLGWESSCANAPVGTLCRTPCMLSNITAPTSTCVMNGTTAVWSSMSGACISPFRNCAGLPTASTAAYAQAWNNTCANAVHGTTCHVPCTAVGLGGGWNAACNDGTWTLTGGCIPRVCAGSPSLQFLSQPWNTSAAFCENLPIGGRCTGACMVNTTGTGYTADCRDLTAVQTQRNGTVVAFSLEHNTAWVITGTCAYRNCTAPSLAGLPYVNQTVGFRDCTSTVHGAVCQAPCTLDAAGVHEVQCNTGNWVPTSGSGCTPVNCSGSLPAQQPFADPFNTSCIGKPARGTCYAGCIDGYEGGGYTTTCQVVGVSTSGVWSAPTGVCKIKTCGALPPQAEGANAWSTGSGACVAGAPIGAGCTVTCNSNYQPAVPGWHPTISCGADKQWQRTGVCVLKVCTGSPVQQLNALAFTNCVNRTAADRCTAACDANSYGSGVTATCSDGLYTYVNDCKPKVCVGLPNRPSSARDWTLNSNGTGTCTGNTVGSKCFAVCTNNAPGGAVEATCISSDTWRISGDCAPLSCWRGAEALPRNSTAWALSSNASIPCPNPAPHGTSCSAACQAGVQGSPWSMDCRNGVWSSPYGGSCGIERCATGPADALYAGNWSDIATGAACNTSQPLSTRCQASCDSVSTTGGSVLAICSNSTTGANWTISGTCNLKTCGNIPWQAGGDDLGWVPVNNATTRCTQGATYGSVCKLVAMLGLQSGPSQAIVSGYMWHRKRLPVGLAVRMELFSLLGLDATSTQDLVIIKMINRDGCHCQHSVYNRLRLLVQRVQGGWGHMVTDRSGPSALLPASARWSPPCCTGSSHSCMRAASMWLPQSYTYPHIFLYLITHLSHRRQSHTVLCRSCLFTYTFLGLQPSIWQVKLMRFNIV